MKAHNKLNNSKTEIVASPSQWVAVLGAATVFSEEQVISAYIIGKALAEKGKNILTGSTTGLPYAASIGAREAGALVVGISPAGAIEQHINEYNKPIDYQDLIIYTDLSIEGRGPQMIRSADACIVIGGEIGTLNEFTAAWLIGKKTIGVLTGNGGVADMIQSLLDQNMSNLGSQVIYDNNPLKLVDAVCDAVEISEVSKVSKEYDPGADVRKIIDRYNLKEKK